MADIELILAKKHIKAKDQNINQGQDIRQKIQKR